MSHGIGGGPGVAASHAAALKDYAPHADIHVGCLRGAPSIEEAAQALDDNDVIVPLLMARGFIHDAIRARLPERLGQRMTAPLGEHRDLPRIVRAKALALTDDPFGSNLLLIGHGTTRHRGADRIVLRHAVLAHDWGFARIATAFLDAPPYLPDVARELVGRPTVAIGYFIDPGPHGIDDVQEGLRVLGDDVRYSGPIGMSDDMVPLLAELAAIMP